MKIQEKKKSLALLSSVALATSTVILGAVNPASASILWNWSYSGGSGTFTTNAPSGNAYLITGITGTAEGVAITSLLPPGSYRSNNNTLFFNPLFPNRGLFNNGGVSWVGADGFNWHLSYDVESFGYQLVTNNLSLSRFSFTATQVTPPATVPEPSSVLGLVGLGLALGSGALRKARK